MKKAKIMLTAITVLAIVGGAFAFKAKTFFTAYCTTAAHNIANTCPLYLVQGEINPQQPTIYYTAAPNAQCTAAANVTVQCNANPARIVLE